MQSRITHHHISKAVARLNARKGLAYPSLGYLLYQDIGGWGGAYRPGFYMIVNDGGGVRSVGYTYRGKTLRETLAKIEGSN